MKIFYSLLIMLIVTFAHSQKEDYNWLGGYNYDNFPPDTLIIEGYRMDFNKKPLQIENNVDLKYGILGNNASISDKDGKLLFYTNGCAVMDKNYKLMSNGDSINGGKWFDIFWKHCSQGYPGVQDVMILPDPGNEKGYYLFHKPNIYNPGGKTYRTLNYSYIDVSLDNGRGDVTKRNQTYFDKSVLFSYFTAIRHQNKEDWWILQPLTEDSIYLTFLLDRNGIQKMPNQNTHQYFDYARSLGSGTARFSPDGTKYALYNYYDQLHVYDFDRATGTLSNHKKIAIYPEDEIDRKDIRLGSVEWSPNGRFIYTASRIKLHQVDLWASDVQNSVVLIDEYNGTQDPFSTTFSLMVQGPDCRIYLTPPGGQYSIHVINKPNELGKACDFVQNGIKFQYPNGGTLPNFPRFRVDEKDKCDPSITSVFGETVFYRRDLEVYPSPSTGTYTIKLPEHVNKAQLIVTNINGQLIYKKEISNSIIEDIDITHQAAGRYNIEVYPEQRTDKIYFGRQVVKI